ncbi:helix-turn-helix domain-containing protein [Clostridium disporicum]|uniref:Putative LexA repressor n=1 Tax=Clostridium disporicum TaxID=84024 RepID=A0A174EPP8_9CLOT|nr:helix-turn-helix domain-containing protein [Clostridium disporicum]CUO39257.1 putative LexA repressor [Clostridium disporicum]
MSSDFSKNLKTLRENLNLKQDFLSQKLGISRSVLSYYESGKSEPTLSMLLKISDFFNISIDQLVSNNLSENINSNSKFDIEYFSVNTLLSDLNNKKQYYLNEKDKLEKICKIEIPNKINELDSLIEYLTINCLK